MKKVTSSLLPFKLTVTQAVILHLLIEAVSRHSDCFVVTLPAMLCGLVASVRQDKPDFSINLKGG